MILAVEAAQAILRLKRAAFIEGRVVNLEKPVIVVRMYAFLPSMAQLLLQRSTAEVQPGFVEVIAPAVSSGRPNHNGSRVGQEPEPLLALNELPKEFILGRALKVSRAQAAAQNPSHTYAPKVRIFVKPIDL